MECGKTRFEGDPLSLALFSSHKGGAFGIVLGLECQEKTNGWNQRDQFARLVRLYAFVIFSIRQFGFVHGLI